MSHGLIFSVSPLSQLRERRLQVRGWAGLNEWVELRDAHAPHVVALEQAVGVLRLEGLLALDGAEPPGVINDRAKPVTCGGVRAESVMSD